MSFDHKIGTICSFYGVLLCFLKRYFICWYVGHVYLVVLPRPCKALCCSGTIIVVRRKTLHCPPFKKYLGGGEKLFSWPSMNERGRRRRGRG